LKKNDKLQAQMLLEVAYQKTL